VALQRMCPSCSASNLGCVISTTSFVAPPHEEQDPGAGLPLCGGTSTVASYVALAVTTLESMLSEESVLNGQSVSFKGVIS